MSRAPKHIRARQDENGELYVNVDDLEEFYKEDYLEILTSEEDQIAAQNLLMSLKIVKTWFSPISEEIS